LHLFVLLIIVIAALLTVSWLKRLPPSQRRPAGLKAGLVIAGALLLLALLTGRVSITAAIVVMAAAIPMVQRLLGAKSIFDRLKSAGGPSAGNTSTVNTRFVEMTLDHDSGEMTGHVTEGAFAGRTLADLSFSELMDLIAECRGHDAQSAAVLEAYLDRYHGESWRERQARSGERPRGGTESMSRKEACEILGVPQEAKREEILAAHRRLMQKLHPDRGGSDYLAAKINQAKDSLLADS
jgi:hypothetical protein